MKINETIADTLNKIDGMIKEHREWNEESKALGLIDDSEKLRMLKRDLYCEVRLSNPNQQKIQNLTGAIDTLDELQQTAHVREQERLKLQLSLPSQIQACCSWFLLLLVLGIGGSYLTSYTCGNSHSMFCGYARSTVYPINKFFQD